MALTRFQRDVCRLLADARLGSGESEGRIRGAFPRILR
jgi:hypothetical protein